MFKVLGIPLMVAMMAAACAQDSESNPPAEGPGGVVAGDSGGKNFGKLGDLYQEKYSSRNCEAIVSGSDVPPQLLMDLRCYGRYPRTYVLECPGGEKSCAQNFPNGTSVTSAMSEGFEQIIVHEYEKGGGLVLSESLTRRISFTSEESDAKMAE